MFLLFYSLKRKEEVSNLKINIITNEIYTFNFLIKKNLQRDKEREILSSFYVVVVVVKYFFLYNRK
jgi:hypothetical protein